MHIYMLNRYIRAHGGEKQNLSHSDGKRRTELNPLLRNRKTQPHRGCRRWPLHQTNKRYLHHHLSRPNARLVITRRPKPKKYLLHGCQSLP